MPATVQDIVYCGQSGEWNASNERTYEVRYYVLSDNPLCGAVYALTAAGLPQVGLSSYGTPYEVDPLAICQRLRPKQLTSLDWEVTATFSTRPMRKLGRDQENPDPSFWPDNPLLRPIQWKFRGFGEQETYFQDWGSDTKDSRAFTNPAGDPYPPEVATFPAMRGSLILSRNYASVPLTWLSAYTCSINSRIFWGLAIAKVRLDAMDFDEHWENGVDFVRGEFQFSLNPNTWNRQVAMQGPRYMDANGKLHYASDDAGHFSCQNVYLNPDGTLRDAATVAASGPAMDTFCGYFSADWTPLKLDLPFQP